MAKKSRAFLPIPGETEIDVIKLLNGKVYKRVMQYRDALKIPPQKGAQYIFYQKGFSQYSNVIEK